MEVEGGGGRARTHEGQGAPVVPSWLNRMEALSWLRARATSSSSTCGQAQAVERDEGGGSRERL